MNGKRERDRQTDKQKERGETEGVREREKKGTHLLHIVAVLVFGDGDVLVH